MGITPIPCVEAFVNWTGVGSVALAFLIVALIGTLTSAAYLILVMVAAAWHLRRIRHALAAMASQTAQALPPVSILKPVHGAEPRLRENLESFFRQDYPNFEMIFGVRDPGNAAVPVVEEICRRYPYVPSRIVFSGPPTCPNAKVFSLDKMIAEASSEYLIISDSDVHVSPDFMCSVLPPLLDSRTGLVTCLYRGVPDAGSWSLLEALGMTIEMSSGVLVADMLEGMRFALGPVMAVRKDSLAAIGGIAATANYYSDDFELGNRIWAAGYDVALSHYVVEHVLIPRSFRETFGDQLRWMQSTRNSRPAGHLGTGLTYAVPFGLMGWGAAASLGHPWLGLGLFAFALLNRIVQAAAVGWTTLRDARSLRFCWLYPVRDLLGFCTWVGSYATRNFAWRGETYVFQKGGRIRPLHRAISSAAV